MVHCFALVAGGTLLKNPENEKRRLSAKKRRLSAEKRRFKIDVFRSGGQQGQEPPTAKQIKTSMVPSRP